MTSRKHVEQHANALLAQILRTLGVDAQAEVKGQAHRKIFDFLVKIDSLTVVLEAEYDNRRQAEKDADKRLEMENPPDILGAISYAKAYEKDFHRAVKTDQPISFAFKRAEEGPGRWEGRWQSGLVHDLAQALRRPHSLGRMPHDEVAAAVSKIKETLKDFADRYASVPAAREGIPKLLQASLPVAGEKKKVAVEQALQLAGLILIGAFLFQHALAANNIKAGSRQVKPPKAFEPPSMFVNDIEKEWQFILEKINYAAIFRIAIAVRQTAICEKKDMMRLAETAEDVVHVARDGVDLMGGVYHELLAELAKPLGAYYTTIPAATMLSALALAPRKWSGVKWQKPKDVAAFRIADLACGSGTLLAAACGQIRDNVMRARVNVALKSGVVAQFSESPLRQTQRDLLENVIWGYDVLDAAVHLTATTLGLMSPEVDFRKSHIYRAALGVRSSGAAMAGSFQLLESEKVSKVLFSPEVDEEEKRIAHVESGDEFADPLPLLDACIMNPPFVVGRKNAPSYSFLSPRDADKVRFKMNALAKIHKFSNAGMGPGFIALAEKYTKPGGRMAFILSTTIASGRSPAWAGARARIERKCDLEHFIVSRDSNRPNFSSETNLQECMFVVRKRENGDKPKERAMFSVLSENPQNSAIALAAARAMMDAEQSGKEWGKLKIDGREIGQFARLRYRGGGIWNGIAFANLQITIAANALADSGRLPTYSLEESRMPLRPLGELVDFGSYSLGRFTDDPSIKEEKNRFLFMVSHKTSYAGYYPGRLSREEGVRQMDIGAITEEPNCYLSPFPKQEKKAHKFFADAGRIVLNRSFRFNTMRRLASRLSVPVQGDNCIPMSLLNKERGEQREKAMILWLNSTPAIMLAAVCAVYCHGSKVMMTLQATRNMPALDLDALNKRQLSAFAKVFDKVAKMKFMPIPQMAEDPARKAIDDALAKILNLPDFDFASLRSALAAEPIISEKSTAAR